MGMFDKMKEPVFLKKNESAQNQLENLRKLACSLDEEGRAMLAQEIKCLEYGILGEESICFELKNSHMPMYILQDVHLQYDGLSAQIDFLIITKKINFIIECKNLYGNIEINKEGNFIRTMKFGEKVIKEGIYSHITQNQRHMDLLKKIKSERQANKIIKLMSQKYFDKMNKSVIVLANPKTILDTK